MIKVDIVRARTIASSVEESRDKLKVLCITVADIVAGMNQCNGLQDIKVVLDKQLEILEQDLYILGQCSECLQNVFPMYTGCEEEAAVYVEEVQSVKANVTDILTEHEIPERIFQLFY